MERVAGVHGRGNGVGRLARDLAAIRAVCLVAVIGGRIVARGHADTAGALEVARGPRERRHGGDLGIHVRGHAVGSQDRRSGLDEQLAVVATVARDGHGGLLEVLYQVIGEALRSATDGVNVHAVGAGAERAAQASGAERELLEERVGDRLLVARLLHGLELRKELLIFHILNPNGEKLVHICHGETLPDVDYGAGAPSAYERAAPA